MVVKLWFYRSPSVQPTCEFGVQLNHKMDKKERKTAFPAPSSLEDPVLDQTSYDNPSHIAWIRGSTMWKMIYNFTSIIMIPLITQLFWSLSRSFHCQTAGKCKKEMRIMIINNIIHVQFAISMEIGYHLRVFSREDFKCSSEPTQCSKISSVPLRRSCIPKSLLEN